MTEKELILVNDLISRRESLSEFIDSLSSKSYPAEIGICNHQNYYELLNKFKEIKKEITLKALELLVKELNKINAEISKYISN